MAHTDNNKKVYINSDGDRVMRVSEVIRMLSKDQLLFWANMLGFKGISYKNELERTTNIGSLVHDVIENYVNPNKLAIIDFDEYNVKDYGSKIEVRHAIESFFKWFRKVRKSYTVKNTEFVVVGKNLGGTIDCIIEGFKDPNKVIFVDYKTSPNFYLTQFLQLAAYVVIYEEVYGPDTVEGVMVIQLDKKLGNEARAKLLPRKKMNLFIELFINLFNVAWCTKALEKSYGDFLETII